MIIGRVEELERPTGARATYRSELRHPLISFEVWSTPLERASAARSRTRCETKAGVHCDIINPLNISSRYEHDLERASAAGSSSRCDLERRHVPARHFPLSRISMF
ncbi:hypothetical protein F2Q69_00007729 [Brassica cretica]|uniref:Uncharacterized protein n=1 Tax=Brassica cretica TaxID=69181 RepID=A0A8S9P428_BRACR|nr:hypothetical protein F2Q69_00007729 [Brassica cretica]